MGKALDRAEENVLISARVLMMAVAEIINRYVGGEARSIMVRGLSCDVCSALRGLRKAGWEVVQNLPDAVENIE
jgi:hypothetical protein